jgi:hypothetical protein
MRLTSAELTVSSASRQGPQARNLVAAFQSQPLDEAATHIAAHSRAQADRTNLVVRNKNAMTMSCTEPRTAIAFFLKWQSLIADR